MKKFFDIFLVIVISSNVSLAFNFINYKSGMLPGLPNTSNNIKSQKLVVGISDSTTIIGNYVWRDINENGIQESSDFPLKGVRIELVNYDSNFVVASAKSDAKGQYEFETDESIEPGYYYLRFSCFEKFIPTLRDVADDGSDSDIDETGKTDTFYLPSVNQIIDYDAGFYLDYPDICEDQTAFECIDAENYSFTELNNSCFTMYQAWLNMPIPGCGSGYAFHNPSWFGFIAGDTIANFLIHTNHCISGGNNIGLQWGVYDNCDMSNMIAGSCPCVEPKEIFVNLNGLVEGKTYYLFIDGCSGTICHFWIEWLTGYCTDEVSDAENISCYGEDIDSYYFCGGKNYKFFTDTIENADKYTWQMGDEIIETENPELDFTFKKSGSTFVSVFGSNFCSVSDPYSKTLYVLDTVYGDLGKINATPEQLKAGFLPLGWKGPEITKYGKDSVLVVNSFGCGQWQFIEVGHPDYEPLMVLYNSTNGDYWTKKNGWKEGSQGINCDPCSGWYGVKCVDGRVTSVKLTENKLFGKLPREIYDLSELNYLALDNNEIYGSFPDSIRKLRKLNFLNLGQNRMSGIIPGDIANLHNLKNLNLYYNAFNYISNEIFKMPSLEVIDLSDNFIVGEIPDYLNLPSLKNLILTKNDFFGSIPGELGMCNKLILLALQNNNFSGTIPSELSNLKELKGLFLSENELQGLLPDSLFHLPELEVLTLNDNKFEGEIFNKINNLKMLSYLSCDNNEFEGIIDTVISGLLNLRHISASNNRLEGFLPAELFYDRLIFLDLSKNKLAGKLPPEIKNAVNISYVDLSYNNFEDTLPKELCSLFKLNTINLNNNKFTGSIPTEIGNLKQLQYLNLKNNLFEGSIPEEIGNMYSLIDFNAANNELTGSLPASIGYLSQLTSLDLNHNNLTGSVPKEMSKLYDIKKINLKDNNLSGCYPEELKQFCQPTKTIIFNNNKLLPWEGDFYRFCGTDDQIGAPCNDGDDTNGTNDKIDIDCKCIGTVATHDTGTGKISFNNPVNDFLILNSELDIDAIEIYDINGTRLKGFFDIKSSVYEIDFSDFSRGMYIMKTIISKEEMIVKLIKI
ncbi:MAG: T9SS type A sorting domain-containing protein [Saprospiraceae bacterium]|nr:T9SS type A sorting domain-containing protein [Saprospiraceae bacterium]